MFYSTQKINTPTPPHTSAQPYGGGTAAADFGKSPNLMARFLLLARGLHTHRPKVDAQKHPQTQHKKNKKMQAEGRVCADKYTTTHS